VLVDPFNGQLHTKSGVPLLSAVNNCVSCSWPGRAIDVCVSPSRTLKPIRRHIGIPHGVGDDFVPQVALQRPGIVALIDEFRAAGVSNANSANPTPP
jgi:hypothetical protein